MRAFKQSGSQGVVVVEWSAQRLGDRDVRGLNPAIKFFRVMHAQKIDCDLFAQSGRLRDWRTFSSGIWTTTLRKFKEWRSFLHFTHHLNTDTAASDFEEHLRHDLGKNVTVALKFRLWLYIVEERGLRVEERKRK